MNPLIEKFRDYVEAFVARTGGTDFKYVPSLEALTWTRTYSAEAKAKYNLHDTRMWIVTYAFSNWTALCDPVHHIVAYVVDYETDRDEICGELLGRVDIQGRGLVYQFTGDARFMCRASFDNAKPLLKEAGYSTIIDGPISEVEWGLFPGVR
jgi:hypothetical protein